MSRLGAVALAALLASAWAAEEACDGPPDEAGLLQAKTHTAKIQKSTPHEHGIDSPEHEGKVAVVHDFVGCFARSPDDLDDKVEFEDTTCVDETDGPAPCRGGMPFYRFIMHEKETFLDCFSFCLEKGLDLSGLIYSPKNKGDECRCGATADNTGVWGAKTPPKDLQLPQESVPEDDERCAKGGMLVWAYSGGLENASVPMPLIEASTTDMKYVHGVAKHVDPSTLKAEDGYEHESEDAY